MKRATVLMAIALGTLDARTASAQARSGETVAIALFEQARSDMQHGDFAAACPKLAESQRMDPANGTLLNLAFCEEKLGKIASAWAHFKDLVERMPAVDDRRPIVKNRVAALAARLPKLTMRLSSSAPPGTILLLDGVELGPSSLGIALPVDPGLHRLIARAGGRRDRSFEISMAEGKDYEWVGEPEAAEEQPSKTVAPPNPGAPEAPAPAARRAEIAMTPTRHYDLREPIGADAGPPKWLGWSAIGIGAAGLVTSVVFGVLAANKAATVDDLCAGNVCRDPSGPEAASVGRTFVAASAAGFAVGALGLGYGIYVLGRPEAKSRVSSMPAGPSVTLRVAF